MTSGKSIRTGTLRARISALRRARVRRSTAAASSAGPTGAPCRTDATNAATRGRPSSPSTGRRPSIASASDAPLRVRASASANASEAGPLVREAASWRAWPTGRPAPTPRRTSPASHGSSATSSSRARRSDDHRRHAGTPSSTPTTRRAAIGWTSSSAGPTRTAHPALRSPSASDARPSFRRTTRPRRSTGPGVRRRRTGSRVGRRVALATRAAPIRTTRPQAHGTALTSRVRSAATSTRDLRRRAAGRPPRPLCRRQNPGILQRARVPRTPRIRRVRAPPRQPMPSPG